MKRCGLFSFVLAFALPVPVIASGQVVDIKEKVEPSINESGVLVVTPILKVEGHELSLPYAGGMVLDEEYIQSTNKGNGDLATILRINPAVQFADSRATSSRQRGEIRPADFSINGALPYQNLLSLDGISFNNDIEPVSSSNGLPNHATDIIAPIQGIAVDTDMIGALSVYDANVPAAFGGFTGGVVDVETRHAQASFAGKVSLRMARSVWDELIIPEAGRSAFEQSAQYQDQPVYDKYRLGVMLEGRTRNGVGLIGNVSRTRSDIPLRGYSAGRTSPADDFIKKQRRENTSISLRADFMPSDSIRMSANITHAPVDDLYFIQNAKDSWFNLKQGGPVAGMRLSYLGHAWTFNNNLSYSRLDSSRRVQSGIDYWKAWAISEQMNWGIPSSSFEGNFGNIDQISRNLSWKISADREELRWGPTRHHLQWGAEYRDRKASYHRINDHTTFLQPRATLTCIGPDGTLDTVACSLSPVTADASRVIAGQGQYFENRNDYRAGYFEVNVREMAAFVQDTVQIGHWNLRAGLRFDHDSMMDQDTIAPRLAVSWDVLGNQSTLLTTGINRYYGRNFFGYKLREGREHLHSLYKRSSIDSEWELSQEYRSANRFEALKIPYNDEWMLGLSQQWSWLSLDAKYIHRDGRDELLRESIKSNDISGFYATDVYHYVNKGRSTTDKYSVLLSLQRPWRWRAVSTQMQLALDHTDVRRNYTTYDSAYNDNSYNRPVRYNGNIIPAYELPQRGYNRPWTARLSTQTRFENLGILWSNFWRWRDGYVWFEKIGDELHQDGDRPIVIDVLESRKNPSGWSWDSTLEYSFNLTRTQQVYARVEVQNVLNRSMLLTDNTTATFAFYEPGRSYWVELGYRF